MKIGYLKLDSEERFTTKRSWRVNAWRVVDENGNDMFQPWCRTRREALETAGKLDIYVPILKVEVIGGITIVTMHPNQSLKNESDFYHKVLLEMKRMGYDCVKRRPSRDGHMTSAPYYIRARDHSWCILDERHEGRCPASYINKHRSMELRNYWATPSLPKGRNDEPASVLPGEVRKQQGGANPGHHLGETNLPG